MQEAQCNRVPQIIQHPPIPPNSKANSNYLTPRQPYLSRTNSNSKSFKKTSVEKSIKQKQIEQQIKYSVTDKIQASCQTSLANSEKNIGLILIHGPFQDTTSTFNHAKTYSKSKKGERQSSREKIDSNKPFDVLSGFSVANQYRNRDKNDDYYLYWKSKAHEYLEANMKLMEEIRKLTRQNEQLKSRIQVLENNTKSVIQIQAKNSQILKQIQKEEESRENNYLVQKMEEMQKQLKKKQIVIKTYEQKIVELNSRIVGDSQRTRLISKLKSEIDTLKSELSSRLRVDKRNYTQTQESTAQESKTMKSRLESKFNNLGRK